MRYPGFIAVCGAMIVLSACVPHSDVMLFGTDTKFGIDVSAPPENAGIPQITVGYKRREFVLMPLLANGENSKVVKAGNETEVDDAKYTGTSGEDQDTYSVLASFGADFDTSAQPGNAKAGGGLAQYFATGMAARLLAEKGGANLVRTDTVQETPPELKELAQKISTRQKSDVEKVIAFVEDNGTVKACRIDEMLDGSETGKLPPIRTKFEDTKGKPIADFRKLIDNGPLQGFAADLSTNVGKIDQGCA